MTWQQGVPIPDVPYNERRRNREVDRFDLRSAKVGESKFFADTNHCDVRYSTRYFATKWGVKLVLRTVIEDGQRGVRVWRMK